MMHIYFLKSQLIVCLHMPMAVLKTIGNTEKLYDKLPALKKHTFIEEP